MTPRKSKRPALNFEVLPSIPKFSIEFVLIKIFGNKLTKTRVLLDWNPGKYVSKNVSKPYPNIDLKTTFFSSIISSFSKRPLLDYFFKVHIYGSHDESAKQNGIWKCEKL